MRKGYILAEVQDSCKECPYVQPLHGSRYQCSINRNNFYLPFPDGSRKPKWCPIHSLPKKRDPDGIRVGSLHIKIRNERNKGWNDAIREIENQQEVEHGVQRHTRRKIA